MWYRHTLAEDATVYGIVIKDLYRSEKTVE